MHLNRGNNLTTSNTDLHTFDAEYRKTSVLNFSTRPRKRSDERHEPNVTFHRCELVRPRHSLVRPGYLKTSGKPL